MSSASSGYAVTQMAAYPYDLPVLKTQAAADLQALRDSIRAGIPSPTPDQHALSLAATSVYATAHSNMQIVTHLMEIVERMSQSHQKSTLPGIRDREWKSFMENLYGHLGQSQGNHGPIADVLLKSLQSHLDQEVDKGIDAVFLCSGPGWPYDTNIPVHVRYESRTILWEDGIARDGVPAYRFAMQTIRDHLLQTLGGAYSILSALSVELIAIELVDGDEINPYKPSNEFPVYYAKDFKDTMDEGDIKQSVSVTAAAAPSAVAWEEPTPMELDSSGSQQEYIPVPNVNMIEQHAFRQQALAKRAEFDWALKVAHEAAAAARLAKQKEAEEMTMRNQQRLLQLRQAKRDQEDIQARRQVVDHQKAEEDARRSQERQAELARDMKRRLEAEYMQRALEKDADAIRARAEQRMQRLQQPNKEMEEHLRQTAALLRKQGQQQAGAERREDERQQRQREQTAEQWRQATELVQRQLKQKRDEEERARMGADRATVASSAAAAAAAAAMEGVKVEQFRPREKDMPYLTAMDTASEKACMMIINLPCQVTGSNAIHTVSTSISIDDSDSAADIMKLVHAGSAHAKTQLVERGIIPEHGIDVMTTRELRELRSDAASASYRLVKPGGIVRMAIVTRQSFPVEAEPYHDTKDLCVQTIQSLVVFDSMFDRERYKPTAQNLLLCKLPGRDGPFQYDDSKTSVVWLDTLPKRLAQTNLNPFFRSWNFQIHRERPMDDWQTNGSDIQGSMRSIFRAIACVVAYDGPCYLICRIPQQLLGRDSERITAEFTVNLGTRDKNAHFLMYALEKALDYRPWTKTPLSREIPDADWFCFIACKARMPTKAEPSDSYHWNTRYQRTFTDRGDTTVDTDFRMSNKAPSSDYSFLDNIVRKALREAGARPAGEAAQQPVDYTGRRDNNQRWPFDVYFANSYTLEKVYDVLTRELKQAPSLQDRPFLAFIARLRSQWFVHDF